MVRQEDYIQKLADYVKKNLTKGYTIDSLKWALVAQKHSRTSVGKALELAQKQLADSAPRIEVPREQKIEIVGSEPKKKGFFARIFDIFRK